MFSSNATTAVIAGLTAFVAAHVFLFSLGQGEPFDAPRSVGRLNGVDIYVYIGDVAIPNKVAEKRASHWQFGTRIRYWDSFLITAPVPEVVSMKDGLRLTIPWTLLPSSVVDSVAQIDETTGRLLAQQLGLKTDSTEWQFERLTRIAIPSNSAYGRFTGIKSLYAVNMFEFLDELGSDYRLALRDAISRCVMEFVQQSGRNDNRSIAIPALAAARHVWDRELVVSYEESFGAILDGITRVEGPKPPQCHLVIWWRVVGHPEMRVALSGLQRALYMTVPRWRDRLNGVLTAVIAIAFVAGVVCSAHGRHGARLKQQRFRVIIFVILAISGAVGATLTQWFAEGLGAAQFPRIIVALAASVAYLLGVLIEKKAPGATGLEVKDEDIAP